MADIEVLINEAADRRDLAYAKNYNGRAYALMDLDWIGYFDTLVEVLEYLDISVEIDAIESEGYNMYVSYKKCDLCDSKIDDSSDMLQIKYRADRRTIKYCSIKNTKNKMPFANWDEIDICENCLKEIIIRKHKKDKE